MNIAACAATGMSVETRAETEDDSGVSLADPAPEFEVDCRIKY
jgi:hypothetical protein